MSLKLRYYAPAYRAHEQILELLENIKSKHSIEYEMIDLKGERGYADEDKEKEVYKKHFLPRARALKARIGEGVAKALRSQRGRGYYYVAGTIALLKDGLIEWFPYFTDPLYGTWKSYDEGYPLSLGFLKMLLEKGRNLLEEILKRPVEETEHEKLVRDFMALNPIGGNLVREEEVGKGLIVEDKYGEKKVIARLKIDLICKTPNEVWVIEVEPELSATALGQAIIYKELYKKEHPTLKVYSAIVCKKVRKELYEICRKYVDRIFILS